MAANTTTAAVPSTVQWADAQYAALEADLGLAGLRFSGVVPQGFEAFARIELEEALETILALNLPALSGEPIRLLGRTGDYWGDADLFAEDAAGRLHMFELKSGPITSAVATQLEQYLLKSAFADLPAFVAYWRDRMDQSVFSVDRLTMYIAAAHAQVRTQNLGWVALSATENGVDVSQAIWDKLSQSEKWGYLQRYLVALTSEFSGLDEVRTVASQWRDRTLGEPLLECGQIRSSPATVIWLVGSHFDAGALERIRGWRAAGVDSRCLELEVRKDKATGALWLRVRREHFPDRTAALLSIAKWRERRAVDAPVQVEWFTYNKAAASGSAAERSKKGLPLPAVDFVVSARGQSQVWRRSVRKGQPPEFAEANAAAIAEAAEVFVNSTVLTEVEP